MITPEDKQRLYNLLDGKPDGKPDRLNGEEKSLTQQFPEVWAEDATTPTPAPQPGLEKQQVLVVIELKPGATPVRKHQYPLPLEI